mmetsp:Transcript_14667/g.52229  ORF Transcript_14667/g.52229 Transcript_14667/m.52229 type:complete len:156 (-) Transcript_14667:1123-1590(-)
MCVGPRHTRTHRADFEDSLSPTWHNVLDGQANLKAAVRGELCASSGAKEYVVNPDCKTVETASLRQNPSHAWQSCAGLDGYGGPRALDDESRCCTCALAAFTSRRNTSSSTACPSAPPSSTLACTPSTTQSSWRAKRTASRLRNSRGARTSTCPS